MHRFLYNYMFKPPPLPPGVPLPPCYQNLSSLSAIFTRLFSTTVVALFSVLIVLVIPLLVIIALPVLLYRKAHQIVTKTMFKDTVRMVHPMGQMFAADFFKPRPRYNIIFAAILDDNLPVDIFTQHVENAVLHKKDPQGNYKFEELHYTAAERGGYFYWEKFKTFAHAQKIRAADYVIPIRMPGSICTDKDLKGIVAGLIAKDWSREKVKGQGQGQSQGRRPPIEFYLVHNYVGDPSPGKLKSVVIIRTHHFALDGYSLFNIILSLIKGNLEYQVEPAKAGGGGGWSLQKVLTHFDLLTNLPKEYWNMFIWPSIDKNQWRLSMEQIKERENLNGGAVDDGPWPYYTNWTKGIDINEIKRIKNSFGVSFQSVVSAVMAKSIQNLMESAGHEVPEDGMKAVTPIPLEGHPDKLENYFGFVTAHLPVGERDPEKRLQMAHKHLGAVGRSLTAYVTYKVFIIAGHLPHWISRLIMDSDMGNTVDFSTFPGIKGPSFVCGHQILEAFDLVGTGPKYIGATLTALSSFGKLKFAINIDRAIYPSEKLLQSFDDYIRAELDALLEKSVLIKPSSDDLNTLSNVSLTKPSSKKA